MKSLYTILLSLFTCIGMGQFLTIQDTIINIKGDQVSVLRVDISKSADLVKVKFEEWMSMNHDVDLDGQAFIQFDQNLLKAKGVIIPEISSQQIDLYALVESENINNSSLYLYASYGYNNWFNKIEKPYEYMMLKDIAFDFVEDFIPNYYSNQADVIEEQLLTLKSEREKLLDKIEINNETIIQLKSNNDQLFLRIKRLETQIGKHESNITLKREKAAKAANEIENLENK